MTLEKRLHYLRKKAGLSKAEVADRLNVSRQAVSRWESGESRPSTDNIQLLCKLYKIPMDSLFRENSDESTKSQMMKTAEEEAQGRAVRGKIVWVRWLLIGIIIVTLISSFLFWSCIREKGKVLDLHDIQGEDTVAVQKAPDFDLKWD